MCNSELRSFEQRLGDFDRRKIAILAISVDSPEESEKLRKARGYTFPLLSDPQAKVIREYGLLHAHAGEDEKDIARPGEYLLDGNQRIRWAMLTENFRVRARPEEVLKAADELLSPQ